MQVAIAKTTFDGSREIADSLLQSSGVRAASANRAIRIRRLFYRRIFTSARRARKNAPAKSLFNWPIKKRNEIESRFLPRAVACFCSYSTRFPNCVGKQSRGICIQSKEGNLATVTPLPDSETTGRFFSSLSVFIFEIILRYGIRRDFSYRARLFRATVKMSAKVARFQ